MWLVPFIALLALGRVAAAEPFVVSDIRVEGLQRISAGTVFNYLPVKVGDTLDDAKAADAVRALFKTGFFKDVRLERTDGVLVVVVEERPAITNIKVSGNKDIETDKLLEALKQVGFAEGRVFDRSLLDKVEQELQRQYFARGKYGVKIETTVTPLPRNRVGVAIDISEGRVAKIRQINIVGNHAFNDKKLLKKFQLRTPKWWAFYSKRDQYSKEKLGADLETLRSFYLDRGYINFDITSTQVAITPDKKDVYITINVAEGDLYRIRDIKLAGDYKLPAQELFDLMTVEQGSLFSRKSVTDTNSKIVDRLGAEGYAFANVNAIPDIDKQNKEVGLTFFVDPGKRVYVRRINMAGNTKTRDEVLRREMRQMEGAWISTEKVKRSRTRLERTGYFKSVNVETPAVPGTADQVDVDFTVEEQASGTLMAGLGYSQSGGIVFSTSVSQDNFLGTGKRVELAFNNSTINTVYSFGYLNPYYTLDGISRGFNAYYRSTDAAQANLASYTTDAYGGGVSFGVPVNEYDFVRVGLNYENLALKTTTLTQNEVFDFIAQHGDTFDYLTLTASWSHDTRNKAIFPDRGVLQSVSAELAVPGVDLQYYTFAARNQWFRSLSDSLTLSLDGNVGYGDGYGDTGRLPFFKNFYAGGIRSVRGFEDNTLGPLSTPDLRPLGGNLRLVGSAEVFFPFPFAPDESSLRTGAFVDAGNVFSTYDEGFKLAELRYSTGVSLTWLSPVGALSFSIAAPLNAKSGDRTQNFQFSLGTTF